jgi:hypothetical protein
MVITTFGPMCVYVYDTSVLIPWPESRKKIGPFEIISSKNN